MINDPGLGQQIEEAATQLARQAGAILAGHFGRRLAVEYKDKHHRDPVTSADKACQEYLVAEIGRRFPAHGILSEEGSEEADLVAPDFLWVLDPLDGTTNFLHGLPIYASSIGVLYRGRPLVGAIYIPWPNPEGGFVLHCRRGGGCFADETPVLVDQAEGPEGNQIIGLPGYFAASMRFGRQLRGKLGDTRTTGSIAYELALTACGVLQYAVIGSPHLWDISAGALAVLEARGAVLTRLPKEKRWHPLESLVPGWEDKPPGLKELRRWAAPLVAGNPRVAPIVADSMRQRFRLASKLRSLSHRLRRSLTGRQGGAPSIGDTAARQGPKGSTG